MDAKSSGRDSDSRRLPYQPGLDGLRALAVAGVFLYHAGVSWMPGGFLGVDLFFVLSGYLITSLLLREFSTDGTIELVRFWYRRARRLFPAVALVILFALLATLTIARDDLGRTRADALSAIVYLTNWHEIIASHSYFNQFGRPSLLQHLWSLAVEEQFYLLWPVLLTLGLRKLHPRNMLMLTGVLAVVSCALMWLFYNPGGDPSRVYYGTDTRAFTLLIGALLAFLLPAAQKAAARRSGSADVIDGVGVAALIGILVLFVTLQDYQPWLYRGGFLLTALVGALLVAAVAHPGGRLGHALGWEPLRWLGARSYGIYLWHWPIMQLTRPGIDISMPGPLLVLLQAAATVGAAALSYRYVEMPIRSGDAQQRLRAFLDRHTPHQRLAWVAGTGAALLSFAGLGFALPAPIAAAAFSSTATASALQKLPAGLGSPGSQAQSGSGSSARLIGTSNGGSVIGTQTLDGLPAGPLFPGAPEAGEPGAGEPGAKHNRISADEVLAVGDSVMLGCAPNLEQLIGHRLRVDAIVGRQADAAIARVAQYRAAGELPSEVIVQIGDNGPVWYADMQKLRRVLKGVPVVVLVNVRLARSWQGEVDQELGQYLRSWPQAVLADWFDHSSQSMLSDGVHPQYSDRGVYAHVVYDALQQAQHNAAADAKTNSTKGATHKS
ncbi:MAG TPA: acyltransferase family protein [Solirubrobacteraceae bacterium]|nr:acyltransferase family protein [Solirubrobacteraceae bacterium]